MARAVSPKRKPPQPAAGPERAIYLYGVTQSMAPKTVSAEGVDGVAPVEALACAGVACWISRVARSPFADHLAENMENLEWLAAASVRHQRVVSEIARRGSVLPARFGTVFLSEDSLLAHVKERKRALLAAFKRIADADEWGVKVFVEERTAGALDATSGADYLRRKAAMASARTTLDPDVRAFAAALQKLAVDSAVGGKVSGGQRHLEWQASFLLPRSRQKQWRAVLERFATRWQKRRRIECTGPWPPYSFVSTHAG
jgi:hypothetical protein